MKHSLRLAVLLVPLLTTWASAGIYFQQELKTPNQTLKMVRYISGDKIRVETQGPAGNIVRIERYDRGKMYLVFRDNKQYFELPIRKRDPEMEAQLQVTVTKTDETRKIGNYNCTRYDVTTKGLSGRPAEGQTTQYWTTTDVDVSEEFEKSSDARFQAWSAKEAIAMAKVKGFPILVETTIPGGKTTETASDVKKQDIPDSMFEVPADYQKVTMPAPGATPPALPPAAPPQGGAGAGKGE